jgi:hypothetical protein
MQDNTWVTAFASVAGLGHVQNALPCQDSHCVRALGGGWQIAVVSDGAGSAAYSELGSDFVARNIAHELAELWAAQNWTALPTPQTWSGQAKNAFSATRKRLETYAENNGYTLKDLACTAIATIYSPAGAMAAHIGDGRGTWRNESGQWLPLFTPFRGQEVNETVFITSDIWQLDTIDNYFSSHVVAEKITAIAISTDGCERGTFLVNVFDEERQKYKDPNLPFVPFFEPNRKGLLQLQKEDKSQAEINEIWQQFLTDGHKQFKHETDDKTLILSVLV